MEMPVFHQYIVFLREQVMLIWIFWGEDFLEKILLMKW